MPGYGPLPLVPNVIKVVIENQGNDGRVAANVCHFNYGGGAPSSADCSAIAEAFFNEWSDNFLAIMPAQTSLTVVTVTDLSTDFSGEGSYDNGGVPLPGTSESGLLPFQAACLLSKFINQRYRGGHPRSYLPIGTTADLNDDGDWHTDFIGDVVGDWGTMIDGVIGGNPYGSTSVGTECAVSYVSKFENPVYPYRRTTPLVYDIPLDGYSAEQKLATQRRRVRRVERRR